MSKTKKIVLAVVGGVVGVGAIMGVAVALFVFGPMGKVITEEEAKQIAFIHAEVEEADTKLLNVELDIDDLQRYYEVEFYVGSAEYQYEINAKTGHIEDFDVEGLREQTYLQTEVGPAEVQVEAPAGEKVEVTMAEAKISEDEALKIVVEKIPNVVASDIWIKADIEDGRPVYEGKAIYDGMEYEFEIDANDGAMLSWEVERADADDLPLGSSHSQSKHHNQ